MNNSKSKIPKTPQRKMVLTEGAVLAALQNVPDPELGLSIVDLGLIYEVAVKNNDVEILMTLTTIGCPLFGTIQEAMHQEIKRIPGIDKINIELTFDPPWAPERMSIEAREQLGFA